MIGTAAIPRPHRQGEDSRSSRCLGSWQDGMGTACDWKSDAGRQSFGRASLHKNRDGEKAKHWDSQTGGRVYDAHRKDSIPCFPQ